MSRTPRAEGRIRRVGAGLALLAALAACDDPPAKDTPEAPTAAPARRAAEEALRSTAGGPVALRGVQVYRQAVGQSSAVCGQVNLQPGGGESLFTLFVAVVTPEGEGRPAVEQHVATSSTTASRVFVEMVNRCYTGGGPQPGQRPGAPPLMPPVPDRIPQAAPPPTTPPPTPPLRPQTVPAPAPGAARGTAPPAPAPGGRRVTLRQNGNLRAHPNGGGTVLRVVEQGTTLRVFAEAPGGWLQVGDAAPWGWLHDSLVAR
ncbi:SH3 domain-containing protein [Roseomonas sp. M0104]|uniref:SH3 domain-containing protein n=1 Tax=Teichococcus coralli TaxID=2545983 RepID=A0A845BHB3_9PROT|nr:SH3 domain-containing protein [Pseudoroseomonas coralli]MXP62849.1 SH3 domain-containing protein [Pseudoroseomonas coralli]